MTLPRLKAMSEYWASNPPIHLMIKAYLGIEGASKKVVDTETNDFGDLMANGTQNDVSLFNAK
jgi:hypothetical protein